MTRVSWERLSGEDVEEFVAALVLKRHGKGHLITPAQGDRGIDIRIPTVEGFDIWQVKRYTAALTSAQKRSVQKSWDAFVEETLPTTVVTCWKLAMPFNPTNEALEWFETFQADGVPTEWVGRTLLDTWAAEEPALVDYYFGNGRDETLRLMAQAVSAGATFAEGAGNEQLLASVRERALQLQQSLDAVDPFYRYEIDLVSGEATDAVLARDVELHPGAALHSYERIADNRYAVTRIYARFEGAEVLRPIKQKITFTPTPGSKEHEAVDNFMAFGTPFSDVVGTVVESQGPAGATHLGQASFSFMALESNSFGLPPLELRVVDIKGTVICAIPGENVRRSSGVIGPGHWLAISDTQALIDINFQLGAPDRPASMSIRTTPATGKKPSEVLPSLRAVEQFTDGHSLTIGVRDGGAALLSEPWPLETDEIQRSAAQFIPFVEALAEIQRHTFSLILVPDISTLLPGQRDEILRTARLLRGETVELDWNSYTFTVAQPEELTPLEEGQFQLLLQEVLTVHIADQTITTDMMIRTHLPAVSVKEGMTPSALVAGDKFEVEPVGYRAAILTAFAPSETEPTQS